MKNRDEDNRENTILQDFFKDFINKSISTRFNLFNGCYR